MNRKNIQDYQMLTRVVDFATNNMNVFPKTTAAPQIVAALAAAVAALTTQASARVTAQAEIRSNRRAMNGARELLKTRIERAEQTGRALKSDKFRLPAKRNDQAWINTGRSFAEAAEPLKTEFAKHGLPQFSETMNAAVESLQNAILGHARGKAMHSRAVRGFDDAMREAQECLQNLDALVANALSDNSQAMAAWTVARTVIHAGGRKALPKPPDPAPSVPAAA